MIRPYSEEEKIFLEKLITKTQKKRIIIQHNSHKGKKNYDYEH